MGPRMEPLGIPALTGYSCEDFPCRTIQSCLLLRKGDKVKYLTWNSIRLNFVKKTSKPNPIKTLRYIKCCNSNSLRHIKSLGILSDTTVRRSAVNREDLKPYWKSEKRPHFSRWSTILLFTSFSKTLLTTERRLTRR